MKIVDQILRLFAEHGNGAYFGEQVSETEHALQAAHLAVQAKATDEIVAAALLHDIGHLLHGLGENVAQRGIDARHEDGGAEWLEPYFGLAVTAPVRMHVAAKRYLCAVESSYFDGLSEPSRLSLKLQGGPMSAAEVAEFERVPHYQSSVAVRRWDDGAKVAGLDVPGLESYRHVLEKVARRDIEA